MSTNRLFDLPPKPRAKPRKLMHVIDAGEGTDECDNIQMACPRCGHTTDWALIPWDEIVRGVPCPKCNK